MTPSAPTVGCRAPYASSARAVLALTLARTVTPALIASMLGLIALPMLFALTFSAQRTPDSDAVAFLVQRYDGLVCALAAPIIALLLGTSAFSAESEDGTILYLVTTTTPRWWISAVRVLFAAVTTAILAAVAVVATGLIATGATDPMGVTRAFAIAAAFAGATYASLFTLLALTTRRALVTGLGYVLFWEGILSATFPGLQYLSVRQWTLSIAAALTDADNARLTGGPSPIVAVLGAMVVVAAAIVIGGRQLGRPRNASTK